MIPKYPNKYSNLDVLTYREQISQVQSYWVDKIPYFKLPNNWSISVIPPFSDAICRFLIIRDDGRNFSIYLDCYGLLGYFRGEPYWEVYQIGEDVERFPINEIEKVIKCIKDEP